MSEHPALTNARQAIELEDELRRLSTDHDETRGWRAMMLAPTIEIWEALLRGEKVPLERLDQGWLRRFGRR